MHLPDFDDVDARLARLLDEFEPAEVTDRQRAEDLVAAALAMYGGALRRFRELAEQHGCRELAASWSSRKPLGRILELHRADSPAPPPSEPDEARQATNTIESILDELDDVPSGVRERSVAMLARVSDLHEAALAQIVGAIDPELRPSDELLDAVGQDHLIASVLLIHDLHPEPIDVRLDRTLSELDRRSGAVAGVHLVALTDAGVHLRVDGTSENDAYRFRLDVERTLAERLPDLPVARIDGGEEPVQTTTVHIPVESLTVRRSDATSEARR